VSTDNLEILREAVEFAAATFQGFRAACSECDDEGRELDWRDVDRRCKEARDKMNAALQYVGETRPKSGDSQ
jgi:hypothetical protein